MRGIYKITNLTNNKCYIGKSEDLNTRMINHVRSLNNGNNKNKHMQSAFNLCGSDNFEIEVIQILNDDDDINEREKYWIEYFKSYKSEYGYNATKGGDGGNSYVDCMTETERENHYKKHKEIRTGENNINYGKHLYHKGNVQKYFSDDEIEECLKDGWIMGVADYIKEEKSKRNSGKNNPFYGKHHSQEVINKINETKRNNNSTGKGKLQYYKDNQIKMINPEDVKQYEEEGWVHGTPSSVIEKMKQTKKEYPTSHKWNEDMYKKKSNCYVYNDIKFYGLPNLIRYLKNNGYPNISRKGIKNLLEGKTKMYPSLLGKIRIIKEDL